MNALTEGNVYVEVYNTRTAAPIAHFGPYVGLVAANEAVHGIDAELQDYPEFDTRLLGEGSYIARKRRGKLAT